MTLPVEARIELAKSKSSRLRSKVKKIFSKVDTDSSAIEYKITVHYDESDLTTILIRETHNPLTAASMHIILGKRGGLKTASYGDLAVEKDLAEKSRPWYSISTKLGRFGD